MQEFLSTPQADHPMPMRSSVERYHMQKSSAPLQIYKNCH